MAALDLTIDKGPGRGKTLRLPADRAFSIGRGQSNDLTLNDRLVSSHHARILYEGGEFVLSDLNSKNHTFLNGGSVAGSVILHHGDEIGIGGCVLAVREATRPAVTLSDAPDTRPFRASIETQKTVAIDTASIKTAITGLGRMEKTLAVLHATGRLLSEGQQPAEFLPRLLDLMFEVVPADRGAVFLKEANGELRPLYARDAGGNTLPSLSISRSVLRKSVEEGTSVLTAGGLREGGVEPQESMVLHQIASAICAPIRGRAEVLGAIYLDSKLTGEPFEEDHLGLLTTVALHAGVAHENARMALEASRRERMAAIGLVVAGLAHDIKNYLLGVTLGQSLVEDEIREKLGTDGREAWAAMKDAMHRITDLVQDMLAYSKPREPDWALADTNEVASAAVRALDRRATERGVLLEVKRHPKVGPFWFDPKTIERCLVNLASNGIDATPGGGTVTVRVQPGEVPDTVVLSVSDTGAGIPPENRSRVFDLFFSTKSSKGTGLGLAVTKKIIEEHGGKISFTTEVNEGTTFTIVLPRRDVPPPPSSQSPAVS